LFRKILISGQGPGWKGPFVHAISPLWITNPTSYLTPGPLDLNDHQDFENGIGSWILKSEPSTLRRHALPFWFINRFDSLIYLKIDVNSSDNKVSCYYKRIE
jgi:hypothetical protein